ncbi:MAG: hypothetical protein ABSC51_00210 [Gaiellaceae bacterium]|jgi:hypothetical protein
MEFELEWVDPSLLICRLSGVATVEGGKAVQRAVLSEPQFRPGIGMIVVETNLDVSALTASDIEQIAALRAEFTHVPPVRSAVVAGRDSPARYGLTRMFEAYTESQENAEVEVFETLDEAMAWINEGDS